MCSARFQRSSVYTRQTQRAVTPPPSIADRPSGQMVEKEEDGQSSENVGRGNERNG
ncbi:hypothetical protein X777_03830 [Ooceraea biroi]|uniref:Uncharacterized protein n=1 Tax=Ooceraea biroi TaxID=2015173 RepID=A0A026WHR7_OOCBI|nr:hypothetical protein X777_03830 [Ooceraea biroi]